MSKEIFLDAPSIGELEKKYINEALETGYVSTAGPFVGEFEGNFASYIGIEKAVSTQSGTAAIHMALHELGIGADDEVIVPALTFVATVNPVVYVGAEPVFVDVEKDTWNIDPEKIEAAITDKTKAIIPVHLYGNPCNMDRIMEIAKKHGLYVIEDATESLGATYNGRHTGTFGDFGCFSFNGNKTITTGGGGMLTSRQSEKADHVKFLVNQAKDMRVEYYHPEIGFNYRMTNIEAALGLAQMERIGELLDKKRMFYKSYSEELKSDENISFQEEVPGAESSRWLTCVTLASEVDIPALRNKLKASNIPTRRVFMPITEFPPFKDYKRSDLGNSYAIYERGLCLPGSTLNSQGDITFVCEKIKEVIR